jgi:hypothetical protein
MIKQLGKMTHPKGCLYMNCKDVDMGTLFCETIFDTSAANKEKAAIDAKLMQGNANAENGLSPESLEMLRHALGSAYVEEERDGKTLISIDWNGIQAKGETLEQQNYHRQVIRETIKQVCEIEKIKTSSDLGQIGITTRDGIVIRAADPKSADYGRPILLDEFMRCKAGTAQKLYEFIALLSDPRVERLEVIGGENRPFTFYRKDLPLTYRVNMTDNPAIRGMGSMNMDSPLTSRLGVELDTRTVPDPAFHDYADRIAQSLTGVPLMQLYYSAKDHFDAHPDQLVDVAKQYRTRGLTQQEILNIPQEEMINIDYAPRTIVLSEQLAEFFAGLKPIFTPESALHSQQGINTSDEYEDYLHGIEIDLRLVTKLLEKSSVVLPEMTSSSNVNYALAFQTTPSFAVEEGFALQDRLETRGTRLEEYVLGWLHQVLVPADMMLRGIKPEEAKKLYEASLKHAANSGIGDPGLREADKGSVKRISELYDIDLFGEPDQQSKILRDFMIEQIRRDYERSKIANPGIPDLPRDNDQILSVQEFHAALEQANRLKIPNLPQNCTALPMPSLSAEDFTGSPFKPTIAIDAAAVEIGAPLKPENLTTRDALLLAIAVHTTRDQTLQAFWNKGFSQINGLESADEAVGIASGNSPSGFAVSTIAVAASNRIEPIHVIKTPDDKYLVITQHIDSRLRRMLKNTNIILVDRHSAKASKTIDDHINSQTPDADGLIKRIRLRDAFLLRNGKAEDEAINRKKTLGELIISTEIVPPVAPIFVTTARNSNQLAAYKLQQPTA